MVSLSLFLWFQGHTNLGILDQNLRQKNISWGWTCSWGRQMIYGSTYLNSFLFQKDLFFSLEHGWKILTSPDLLLLIAWVLLAFLLSFFFFTRTIALKALENVSFYPFLFSYWVSSEVRWASVGLTYHFPKWQHEFLCFVWWMKLFFVYTAEKVEGLAHSFSCESRGHCQLQSFDNKTLFFPRSSIQTRV